MPNQNRQTCLHRYTIEAINRDISPQKEIIEKLRGSHFNGLLRTAAQWYGAGKLLLHRCPAPCRILRVARIRDSPRTSKIGRDQALRRVIESQADSCDLCRKQLLEKSAARRFISKRLTEPHYPAAAIWA